MIPVPHGFAPKPDHGAGTVTSISSALFPAAVRARPVPFWHEGRQMTGMPDSLPAGPLELRRWRTDLVDDLMTAIRTSQPELARWLPWADPMPSRDAELEVLRQGEIAFDAGEVFGYFIYEPATSELVGGGGLPRWIGPGGIEIGYWVRSDRTGRGYATAAARALTEAAFDHLGVDYVEIHMDQANHASAAVPPKLGYLLDRSDDTSEILTSGQTGHGWVWTMTRERWRTIHRGPSS